MLTRICPQCQSKFDAQLTKDLPFCSKRCRIIDLGQWLDEEISLPVDLEDQEDAFFED